MAYNNLSSPCFCIAWPRFTKFSVGASVETGMTYILTYDLLYTKKIIRCISPLLYAVALLHFVTTILTLSIGTP